MSEIYCSFCGKHKDEREILVNSPDGKHYICDSCVEMSKHILKESGPSKRKIIPFKAK